MDLYQWCIIFHHSFPVLPNLVIASIYAIPYQLNFIVDIIVLFQVQVYICLFPLRLMFEMKHNLAYA